MAKGFFLFLCLFALTLSAVVTQEPDFSDTEGQESNLDPPVNITCNQTYTSTNGTIRYNKRSSFFPDIMTCTWYIQPPENATDNHTIFLVFENLYLGLFDNLKVTSDEGDLAFNPNFEKPGSMAFFTGKSKVKVTLTTKEKLPKPKSFQIQYYRNSVCNHTFDKAPSGIFHSPEIDRNVALPITCNIQVAVQDKNEKSLNLWFSNISLENAEMSIQGSEQDSQYNVSNLPLANFLAKDILTIIFQINNHSSTEPGFIVNYNSVSEECSDFKKFGEGPATPLLSPDDKFLKYLMSVSSDKSLTCQWQLESDQGSTITVTIKNASFAEPSDQLLILDGSSSVSPVLLDLSIADKERGRAIFSSGNKLFIVASSMYIAEAFAVNLEVSQTKAGSGGHHHTNGTFTAKGVDSSTYLLEVEADQQVKLTPNDKSIKLNPGSRIDFYSDFLTNSTPFFTLLPDQKVYPIVSPTWKMSVVTKGFQGDSTFTASFAGVQPGCFKLATGTGDTYSVSGNCDNTCAWTVHPDMKEGVLAFHFQSISLSDKDEIVVRQMDAAQTLVANVTSPSASMPDLWLPAADGAFIQVTRGNCNLTNTVLTASYLTLPECQATLTPQLGETLQISSPNFPNQYPLGASCTWTVKKPTGSKFLHLSLKELSLAAPNHILNLFSLNGTTQSLIAKFSGSVNQLPDDMPVFTDLVVEFVANMSALQGSTGFNLEILVIEYGEVLTSSVGTVMTPGFPAPVKNSSLSAWIVKVPSNASQQAIIEFVFNKTTEAATNTILTIFDGSSIRSPVLEYNISSSGNLSRTNTLILLYNLTASPGPAFLLNYSISMCNMSNLCENKICMHDDWFCNGINDCGDFSDERYCNGSFTPPSPTPPIPPAPAPKGASTGVLAGGVVASLVVGILLGVISPIAYRRYRDRQTQTYTSLNS